MLQRVQSIFMFLSAVAMGGFIGLNSFELKQANGNTIIANAFQILQTNGTLAIYQKDIFYVAVLAGLSILLSIFTIFQYRNRIRQTLLLSLNSLLIMAAVGVLMYHIKTEVASLETFIIQEHLYYGFWASLVALVGNFLANRFIKKDEKLVKSADRMR